MLEYKVVMSCAKVREKRWMGSRKLFFQLGCHLYITTIGGLIKYLRIQKIKALITWGWGY